jgi:hypothetical protein
MLDLVLEAVGDARGNEQPSMTGPAPTSLLAKIVLPHGQFEPAGHVVVSWEPDPSGSARFEIYPQEHDDAEEIYTRLTILPSAGDAIVRIVLVDAPAFEGPLRDVAVHQALHGVSFTIELAPCEASHPEPSPAVDLDQYAAANRLLAEALRPFVALWSASERDPDEQTLDGNRGAEEYSGRDDAVCVGHLRALIGAAIEAGLVDLPLPQPAPIVPGRGT